MRPAVAGGVVVSSGGGEVFALDARTGKERWRRPTQGRLRGVGDDGETTLVSLEPVSGHGATLLAVTRDGSVVRQIEDRAAVGTPAVAQGFAFLPWNRHYVTVYDLVHDREAARVVLQTPTSRAFAQGGALFFGELGATRFDGQIRFGSVGCASTLTLPTSALASASDGFRVYARPTTTGPPAVASGRFAASHSRTVLGLDAVTDAVAWARAQATDVLGGAAATDGFVLCDAAGKVSFIDAATGALAGEVSLGRALDACVVQVDALTIKGKLGGGRTARSGVGEGFAGATSSLVESP